MPEYYRAYYLSNEHIETVECNNERFIVREETRQVTARSKCSNNGGYGLAKQNSKMCDKNKKENVTKKRTRSIGVF